MNAMSHKAKITLEKYRASEALGESERARLFDALQRRVAAGDWPAAGVDVGPPQPVSPGGFVAQVIGGPIGKIGLGLVVAAVPAAWLLAQRGAGDVGAPAVTSATESAPRQPPPTAPEGAPKAPATAGTEVVAPGGTAEMDALRPARPARAVNPLPAKREAAKAPEAAQSVEPVAAVRAPAEEPTPKVDTIDEEVTLLGSAHASLRAGRPSEALAKLAEHKRRFPTSKLAESREVARIIALCQAGQRKTARAAAERFLASHSGSPLANRVRTVCADTEK